MMALDFHSAASAVHSATGTPLQLRVGLHTGPVRGGVIGNVRARFCLFGDVVNTASRMESTADAGTIQISKETFDILGLDAGLFERKERAVRGKGTMATYTLRPGTDDAAAVRKLLAPLITDEPAKGGRSGGGTPGSPPQLDRGVSQTGAGAGQAGPSVVSQAWGGGYGGFGFGGSSGAEPKLKRASSGVPTRWEQIGGGGGGGAHPHNQPAPIRETHTGVPSAPAHGPSSFTPRRTTDTSYFGLSEIRDRTLTTGSTVSLGEKSTGSHQSGIVNENMDLLQEKTLDLLIGALLLGGMPLLVYVPMPFFLLSCCGCAEEEEELRKLPPPPTYMPPRRLLPSALRAALTICPFPKPECSLRAGTTHQSPNPCRPAGRTQSSAAAAPLASP